MAFQRSTNRPSPIGGAEDTEFSMEQADADDLEALARAEAADNRVEQGVNDNEEEQGGSI